MPDPVTDPPKPPTVTIASSSLMESRRSTDEPMTASVPGHESVVVKILTPVTIIAVRAGRVFVQSVLGGLTMSTGIKAVGAVPALDFLHILVIAASFAVGTTTVCVLQNILELLTKFDQSHPTLAG